MSGYGTEVSFARNLRGRFHLRVKENNSNANPLFAGNRIVASLTLRFAVPLN